MKMIKKLSLGKFILIISLLISAFFISCSNGYQDLAVDFTEVLTVPASDYSIHNVNFDEKGMLSDTYLVAKDMTLCLYAPSAVSYEWKIYLIQTTVVNELYNLTDTTYKELNIPGYIPLYSKQLNLYVPDVEDLLPTGTYKLVLKVTDGDGNEYTDSAALVIYDPFYDIN